MNSREWLLSKTGRRYKDCAIDGQVFCFQSLTDAEQVDYELQGFDKKKKEFDWNKARRLLICKTLVDSTTKARLFEDKDFDQLKDIDGALIAALYKEADEHTGPMRYSKAVEAERKNSDEAAG